MLTEQDGLLSNDVWSVLVDDETIWLGTDRGIARYDGSWTNYPNAPNVDETATKFSGLPLGTVTLLAKSGEDDSLWAAVSTGAVSTWNGDSWSFEFSINPVLKTMLVTGDSVLLGTDSGLLRYDRERLRVVEESAPGRWGVNALWKDGDRLWAGTDNGLWRRVGKQWFRVRLPEESRFDRVTTLWQGSDGRLWVGTDSGVHWFDPSSDIWSDEPVPIYNERDEKSPVTALSGDQHGNIWAGSSGAGARKFLDDGAVTLDVARSSGGGLTTPQVRDVEVDPHGTIWLATSVGLFRYQEGAWYSEYREQHGLDRKSNAVNDLLVDRWGRIWVATLAGIRLKEHSLVDFVDISFTQSGGFLPSDAVNVLEEDAQGGIWAGTFSGLARHQMGEWTRPVDSEDLASAVITDFNADDFGIWIGTEAGLHYYHLNSRRLTDVPELAGRVVEVLARDSEHRLWVGTAADGIWVRSIDATWQHMVNDLDVPGTLPGNKILPGGLARDPLMSGGMWANVHDVGLVHWDGEGWREYPNELPSKVIYRLYSDPATGGLWVGSEGGVSHFDGTTWGTLSIDDGLRSTAIFAVAYEPDDAYWFGGPEGLTRYERDKGKPWVRIRAIEGAELVDGHYRTPANQPVLIDVVAGDLQTDSEKMKIFYRFDGAFAWQPLRDHPQMVMFGEPKSTTLEFMARDQAFNYSEVSSQELTVLPPAEMMTLPLLGEVKRSVFGLLIVLAAMAISGFGYVSFELVRDRMRSYAAMDRGFNPYVSGEPIRSEDMFYGRRQLLQRIVDTLHNNSIMIHGERRIGKTTLLYQLSTTLQQIDDPDYWFLPIYIDLEGTTQEEFFHFLIEEIAVGVSSIAQGDADLIAAVDSLGYHEHIVAEYTDRFFNHDLRALLEVLQQFGEIHHEGRQLRLILLLDEMDVISKYDHLAQQQLRRIFMRDFSATLGAVVAGIQISREWDRVESPWFNLFNEIALEPFTREQALELLIEPVRSIYRFDPSALEYIIEVSNGRPFRIQQYALEAVNHMLGKRGRRITLDDVQAVHGQIEVSYAALNQPPDANLTKNDTAPRGDNSVVDADADLMEKAPDISI